ncbi:MAG: hypothetical protein KGJ50_01630 [Xanthomonadaceae bacterium]|nr:hypothetical protein [Xanthomonadaceae bacterium]
MSIVEEIDGRRIAKDVEARAKALEVLDRPRNALSLWWSLIPIIAIGLGLGVFGQHDALLIKIIAGTGYAFGIVLLGEVVQLRRRLDAVITLLRQGPDPRI